MSHYQEHRIKIGLPLDTDKAHALTKELLKLFRSVQSFKNDHYSFKFNGVEQRVPTLEQAHKQKFNVFECEFTNDANYYYHNHFDLMFKEIDSFGAPAYGIWFSSEDVGCVCRSCGAVKKSLVDTVPDDVSWCSLQDFTLNLTMPKEEWAKMLNCSCDVDDIDHHYLTAEVDPIDQLFGKDFVLQYLGGRNITNLDAVEHGDAVTICMWADFGTIVANTLDVFIKHFYEAAEIMKQRNGEIYMSVFTVNEEDNDEEISRLYSNKDYYVAEFESAGNEITNLRYYRYEA